MSLGEKYREYKDRKEARAFFNQHNNEKANSKDFLIAFGIGLSVSIVLGFIMELIITMIGINFSYFSIVVGILQATAIKKVLNKSGEELAVLSILTFILGIILAQVIRACGYFTIFNLQVVIETFVYYVKYMFIGDFLNTIIYLFGAIASYMVLKD